MNLSLLLDSLAALSNPAFRLFLQSEGIKTIMLHYQSPNLNVYDERWVRSVKIRILVSEIDR